MALEAKAGNIQILKGTGDSVKVTFYSDGTVTDPTGTTKVTVTRADGTVLIDDADASLVATSGTCTKALTSAQLSRLDILTAVWTATLGGASQTFTTRHEVVGGFLFTESEARAWDNSVLNDADRFPDADLQKVRKRVTDLIQKHTGVSWVPRFDRIEVEGDGSRVIDLPHHTVTEVISCTINDGAQTVSDITIDKVLGRLTHRNGIFSRPTLSSPLNVVIEYAHGKQDIEDGVDQVALMWARKLIVPNKTADTMTSQTDAQGNTFRFARFNPSGIPFVDAWIADHNEGGVIL